MTIVRIERAVYAVEDVAECTRFFQDFGLDISEQSDGVTGLLTQTGQRIELRPLDAPGLPPAVQSGSTLREVVWGVAERDALSRLGAELARDRAVTEDADGTVHTLDETGFGLGLTLARPRPPGPWRPEVNSFDAVRRVNRPLEAPGRVRPLRMCHVAWNIPKRGHRRAVDFYLDRLGFLATDKIVGMGTFLRAPGDTDQHSMLLCHRPDRAGINHIAYEVRDFEEVVLGGNQMIDRGWREARKLGRHTIGSNVFRFLHAPCGGRVEYAADMDRVDDTYRTRVHQTTPPHTLWTLRTNREGEA